MKILTYLMLLAFITSCALKTSTPEEFMNSNKIPKEVYNEDLGLLKDALKAHYDSINSIVNPRYVTKLLGAKIDTVFHGNDNKIVFLALVTKENEFAEKGIQYAGECYIAYKKNNIKSLYQLKYSSTSIESLEDVSELTRKLYLVEMNHKKDVYNINDTRFWDSYVWEEAKEMRKKRKSFEEMKKTHPENVYDPNR